MRTKALTFLVLCLGIFVSTTACSRAEIKIILRPWWPRAIVVAPQPRPEPLPPPHAPPKPAPPPQRPAQIGYIDLRVWPDDASVFVDDEYRGSGRDFGSRQNLLAVVKGSHAVSLRRNGYRTESLVAQIKPDEVLHLDVTLDSMAKKAQEPAPTYRLDLTKTASLVLQVEPSDASVYVDDAFLGAASQFDKDEQAIVLRTGSHSIQIARPGYVPYSTVVELASGHIKEVHVSLKKVKETP